MDLKQKASTIPVDVVDDDEWNAIESVFSKLEQPAVSSTNVSYKRKYDGNNNNNNSTPHVVDLTSSNDEVKKSKTTITSVQGNSAPKIQDVSGPGLVDILPIDIANDQKYGLDLLFVGDNPGLQSNREGHWYAHHSNHFWELLHKSGFTSVKLAPKDDKKALDYGVGLTCLCKRASRTIDELSDKELQDGFKELLPKLRELRPKAVCFNGKKIFQIVTNSSYCTFGLQPKKLDAGEGYNVACFVIPSTSARVQTHSKEDKLVVMKKMKSYIDSLN